MAYQYDYHKLPSASATFIWCPLLFRRGGSEGSPFAHRIPRENMLHFRNNNIIIIITTIIEVIIICCAVLYA